MRFLSIKVLCQNPPTKGKRRALLLLLLLNAVRGWISQPLQQTRENPSVFLGPYKAQVSLKWSPVSYLLHPLSHTNTVCWISSEWLHLSPAPQMLFSQPHLSHLLNREDPIFSAISSHRPACPAPFFPRELASGLIFILFAFSLVHEYINKYTGQNSPNKCNPQPSNKVHTGVLSSNSSHQLSHWPQIALWL